MIDIIAGFITALLAIALARLALRVEESIIGWRELRAAR